MLSGVDIWLLCVVVCVLLCVIVMLGVRVLPACLVCVMYEFHLFCACRVCMCVYTNIFTYVESETHAR